MQSETKLQMVQRHVRQGRDTLVRQRAVIERLQVNGFATNQAEELLAEFQNMQALHEEHLARIALS